MGAKKKVDQSNVQKPMLQETKLKTIKLKDKSQYKIIDNMLIKHSLKFKNMIEENKYCDEIYLPCQKVVFEFILHYMQLIGDKQIQELAIPLKTNLNIVYVLEKNEAEYINKILEYSERQIYEILQTVTQLRMQQLKKRILAVLAISIMKMTISQIQQKYQLNFQVIKQDEQKQYVKNIMKQEEKK